jgi:anti-sigma factor RsiW
MSTDVHTLIGAWVLDAVDPDERRQVDAHLTECASCSQEAAELREAVWRLSDVTLAEPPPAMRERVLAQVRRTRQEAPAASEPEPAAPRPARPSWRLPRLRLALGAAALAAVAAFAGVFATWTVMKPGEVPEADRMAAVLEAPDAEIAYREAEGGGRVAVIASESLDEAVVVVAGLAAVDDEHSYQVWLVDEAGAESAGVMDPGDSSASMWIDGLGDTDLIGVTEEPAGGSTTPTLPIIADVALPA